MSEEKQSVTAQLGPDLFATFESVDAALIFIARTAQTLEEFVRYARHLTPEINRYRSMWLDYRSDKHDLRFKRILTTTPLSDGRKLYEAIDDKRLTHDKA